MIRIFKFLLLVIPLAIAHGAYAGPHKKIDPQPTPRELIAVENALASADLVGLYYIDMDYAFRLEKIFLDEGDSAALSTPTGTDDIVDDTILGFLRQSGLRPGETVDYILGAFTGDPKGAGQVQVALGNFPVKALTQKWKNHKSVKQTEVNGRTAWLWSRIDKETCKPSAPELMVIDSNRMIIGDPETVAWLLKRLDKAQAAKNLSSWRKYRKNKLIAFAIFLPKSLENISQNMIARMFAHSAQEQMVSVTGIYGGGTITWKPEGINLELLLESSNVAWNREQQKKFQEWKKKTYKGIEPEFKNVKNLLSYLNLNATDKKLVLQVKINEALVKDIGKVAEEGMDLFTSSLSSSISISGGGGHKPKEQILPLKDVNQYRVSLKPKDLDPFDTTASPNESYAASAGPFGIRIKGIKLNPNNEKIIDLHLEVVSSPFPEMEINPFGKAGEGTGAWFRVTHVFDQRGKELLLDEPCGKDRNAQFASLHKGFRNVEVKRVKKTPTIKKLMKDKPRWSSLTLHVLQGTHTAHLRRGILLSDIARIEGEVLLQLPAEIVKKRVKAPFKNKVVQVGGIRIKMKEAQNGAVSFTASGNVGQLLETRALNASGKYLRSASNSSMPILLGQGVSKNRSFSGTPKTVEFVLAGKTTKEIYPVTFAFQRPDYPSHQIFKRIAVETLSKRAFLQKRRSSPQGKVCSRDQSKHTSGAFHFCLHDHMNMQGKWQETGKYATGTFIVHTQDNKSITHNLSAAQMTVEKVIVQDGHNPARKTLPVQTEQFLLIDSNYAPPLKGSQFRMEAGPIPADAEHLKPVGFEGYLKIRLPRKLDSFRLDLNDLGNTAAAANGLKVRFTGLVENTVHLEIEGPRETLVQFQPQDGSRKPLTQGRVTLKKSKTDKRSFWQAEVHVPPETRYMKIVYASKQDTWKIPFHIEKKSP